VGASACAAVLGSGSRPCRLRRCLAAWLMASVKRSPPTLRAATAHCHPRPAGTRAASRHPRPAAQRRTLPEWPSGRCRSLGVRGGRTRSVTRVRKTAGFLAAVAAATAAEPDRTLRQRPVCFRNCGHLAVPSGPLVSADIAAGCGCLLGAASLSAAVSGGATATSRAADRTAAAALGPRCWRNRGGVSRRRCPLRTLPQAAEVSGDVAVQTAGVRRHCRRLRVFAATGTGRPADVRWWDAATDARPATPAGSPAGGAARAHRSWPAAPRPRPPRQSARRAGGP
jgi:hypothetical protein